MPGALLGRWRSAWPAGGQRGTGAAGPLTAQELQIARLAAEGHTNKQLGALLNLSHRTVSTHLYRLFPKLGMSSLFTGVLGTQPDPAWSLRPGQHWGQALLAA